MVEHVLAEDLCQPVRVAPGREGGIAPRLAAQATTAIAVASSEALEEKVAVS